MANGFQKSKEERVGKRSLPTGQCAMKLKNGRGAGEVESKRPKEKK